MDLNVNVERLQGDAFTKFESAMESAKTELISDIKSSQRNLLVASAEEVPALKRKLEEKKTAITILNQKISKLTEEKNQVEIWLKLAQDSKEGYKKRLQEETQHRKQLELALAEKDNILLNGNENVEANSPTPCTYTKLLLENSSSENRMSSSRKSQIPNSSTSTSTFATEDVHFDELDPASRKRTMTSSSSPSSTTESVSSQRAAKLRKESEEPSASSGNLLLNEGSILDVPELYRINYGFSNNYQLDLCPHARDFWFDSIHASSTKYFIRFHHHSDAWGVTNEFIIKEQVGLAEPIVFQVKLADIVQLLEESIKKPGGIRIFVDVRDCNIFSDVFSQFFQYFGPSVTHFSFGRRLYSSVEVYGDFLLDFIFKNLPNVEYLAFSDNMLNRLGSSFSMPNTVRDQSLKKLKILRIISIRFFFGTPFIMAILQRAPALSSVLGVPLHLLEGIEKQFLKKSTDTKVKYPWLVRGSSGSSPKVCMDSLKSVFVVRKHYCQRNEAGEVSNNYFVELMSLLHLCPNLEELNTRVYFIYNENTRKLCLEMLTKLLKRSAHSLKVLQIEPLAGTEIKSLKYPRLEKCETLQLIMKLLPDVDQRYFPRGAKLLDFFPGLKTVEIILTDKSGDGEVYTVENSLKGNKASELFDAHFSTSAFRSSNTPKTVQRLHLANFTPLDLMDKFQNMFPHITILCLNQTFEVVNHVLPDCIRLWSKLKQLVLQLTFSGRIERNLDSAFTGIPPDTCKDLETLGVEVILDRIAPGIFSLKDLTLLKIVLFHKGPMDSKFNGNFMTPVSATYGFGKENMPNLDVIVGFDDRVNSQEKFDIMRHLEPMKNYITIDK